MYVPDFFRGKGGACHAVFCGGGASFIKWFQMFLFVPLIFNSKCQVSLMHVYTKLQFEMSDIPKTVTLFGKSQTKTEDDII